MALHRLDNSRWGFESNCFVCEPANPRGLGVAFSHDDEADVVRAEFTLGDAFSGAPTYVHGGVTLAILDEAMAWATIALADTFAVTAKTSAAFLRPVRVGRPYTVEARVAGRDEAGLATTAVVRNSRGADCATAEALFVPLSAGQATDALGTEATGGDAGYVRG